MIFKLKQFGIRGVLLDWIKDYLQDRKQRVVIDGQISEWISILSGVSQGSILGPLLFLIYTNDIVLDIRCEIFLFADDTVLSIQTVNNDLNKFSRWVSQWLVSLNPTKTKYMIFSKKLIRKSIGIYI